MVGTGILVITFIPVLVITILYLVKFKKEGGKGAKTFKTILIAYLITLGIVVIIPLLSRVLSLLL